MASLVSRYAGARRAVLAYSTLRATSQPPSRSLSRASRARSAFLARLEEHALPDSSTGAERPAIYNRGQTVSYAKLWSAARGVHSALRPILARAAGRDAGEAPRVAFCLPANASYVSVQIAAWIASCIAVPLFPGHSRSELEYLIGDSAAAVVVCAEETRPLVADAARSASATLLVVDAVDASVREVCGAAEAVQEETRGVDDDGERVGGAGDDALIIYTSGTTGRPKGVVWTHDMLEYQLRTLSDAWRWSSTDHIVSFLPLHHIHGVVNVVNCALWNGASLDMMERFSAPEVWLRLAATERQRTRQRLPPRPTLLMAVPTIYARLIAEHSRRSFDAHARPSSRRLSAAARALRLYVCGSAALLSTHFHQWGSISGQRILERYGMTEVGMALSNPLMGRRVEASVGMPLLGVQTKVVDVDSGEELSRGKAGEGELRIAGPGVFHRYWRSEEATEKSFDGEGFFRTGDIVRRSARGRFWILGRASTDVIKSAGHKLSSLEIERELLEHPSVAQAAVVGVPDEDLGERVVAVLVAEEEDGTARPPAVEWQREILKWCRERMSAHMAPREIRLLEQLPRNAMGKVEKKKLVLTLQQERA